MKGWNELKVGIKVVVRHIQTGGQEDKKVDICILCKRDIVREIDR